MDDISRRQALKSLAVAATLAATSSCTSRAGRDSNCANYTFDQISDPVIDMHAHFFNATDLLAAEYVLGPATNDFLGDRFRHTRRLLARIANGILGLQRRRLDIRAATELAWLNLPQNCSPMAEYTEVSKEFFELISSEDREQKTEALGLPIATTFQNTLNSAAAELGGGFQESEQELFRANRTVRFDENTVLNAAASNSVFAQQQEVLGFGANDSCPNDPGFLSRILAFVGRALVRRSTNIQAYYDRYSLAPIDGYGVRYVANIGCDFDFFLECNEQPISPIEDQIAVNEALYAHTQGYAIPILGVNPWKMYHYQDYADLVDTTLARGIYKGVKLYPSMGYSVTGDIRPGITDRQCDGKGVSPAIVREGMDKLFDIVSSRGAYLTSHTTYSKGAEVGAEALASAVYWKEVLESRRDLRVNFGHMGDPGDKRGEEWRDGFLRLMNSFENVHADFGYHDYADYDTLKGDLQRFKDNHGASLFDKISYGSDWYMISKDKGANAYLCDSARGFERAVDEGVISGEQFKAMFYGNAARFLQLADSVSVA